jgi:hypothetical protein
MKLFQYYTLAKRQGTNKIRPRKDEDFVTQDKTRQDKTRRRRDKTKARQDEDVTRQRQDKTRQIQNKDTDKTKAQPR